MDTPSSSALFARAQRVIPGGVNSPVRAFRSVGGSPFFTAQADGPFLRTADGRELIDFVCTWGPAILGHNAAPIREALAEALHDGTSFGTPGPREVEMAERITRLVPSVAKVRMCNSGTEANLTALRLARGFTGRSKVIKFAGCYHGHVDALLVKAGSGALTLGQPDSAGIPASIAAETVVLPYNDLAAVETAFATHPDEIAGVIVESYPANCGLILPLPGYLEGLQAACKRHGALLIFDEVMTGFRLGLAGVQGLENVTPDLTAMGKVIGGGLPVGALGGRADVMDYLAPVGPVYQAGTLSGNPLAMAAGNAALATLEATQPFAALNQRAQRLREALLTAAQRKGIPLQVPQTGSMFALFFAETPVTDLEAATASGTAHFKRFFHLSLDHGVYLPPSPFETCFLSTAHHDAVIDQACEVFTRAIGAL